MDKYNITTNNKYCQSIVGDLFEGYKVCEWTKKEVWGNYLHESTLVSSL